MKPHLDEQPPAEGAKPDELESTTSSSVSLLVPPVDNLLEVAEGMI